MRHNSELTTFSFITILRFLTIQTFTSLKQSWKLFFKFFAHKLKIPSVLSEKPSFFAISEHLPLKEKIVDNGWSRISIVVYIYSAKKKNYILLQF